MKRFIALAAGVIVVALALAGLDPAFNFDRERRVARVSRSYKDPARRSWVGDAQRPLEAMVWYPARQSAREREWYSGFGPLRIFRFGYSAEVGPPQAGRFPLIVLSHGTGGRAAQLAWLAEALASRGYVVVGVDHHGNTSTESGDVPHGFYLWWERAADLSRVIDQMLIDDEFAGMIDPSKIGAAGFSLGGNSVLALAGARIDLGRYDRWCESRAVCEGPPEAPMIRSDFWQQWSADEAVRRSVARAQNDYTDRRVRAVAALAPALVPAFSTDSLQAVGVPVALIVGGEDPLASDARELAGRLPDVSFVSLPGVGHYTFLAVCGVLGKVVLSICHDSGGVERPEVHRHAATMVAEFFRASFQADPPEPTF